MKFLVTTKEGNLVFVVKPKVTIWAEVLSVCPFLSKKQSFFEKETERYELLVKDITRE